ncbi:hypothetical protein [Sphingomonas turrisvirgatae]|uniref:Uncharacterized protein n=1 Tax=Sphingomonas turrisvirgatae TaxID=1888892 RepID=A0A1E3LZ35_9SPHN|nr:hypothetical protein [Sphingomonas turrisvirgatae]ODP39082.1 hypothetical protein BFL28_12035 [Sphingomonas turrisvirgatae]
MKVRILRIPILLSLAYSLANMPAVAQASAPQSTSSAADNQDGEQPVTQQRPQTPIETNPSGRTARSSVGQVGQRQTRDTAADQAGIKPMARIASRVQNRVQNRIRNRIDRYYSPQANATDPFAVAGQQARKVSRPR